MCERDGARAGHSGHWVSGMPVLGDRVACQYWVHAPHASHIKSCTKKHGGDRFPAGQETNAQVGQETEVLLRH